MHWVVSFNLDPTSITFSMYFDNTINELKLEGELLGDVVHRQVKYLNNRLESDHGKLKRHIHPTRGFQSMKTAYVYHKAL